MKSPRTALSYLLLFLVFFVPSVAFALHSKSAEEDVVVRAAVYLQAVGFNEAKYQGLFTIDGSTKLPKFLVVTPEGKDLTLFIRSNPDGSFYLKSEVIYDSFSSSFDFAQKVEQELISIKRALTSARDSSDESFFRQKEKVLEEYIADVNYERRDKAEGWP